MSNTNPYQSPESASDGKAPLPDLSLSRSKDELIVLATFENSPEAHCLRGELENNGIAATVSNELSAQVVGASLFGRISAIWIEVLVLKSDAEAALEIKNRFQAEQSDSKSSIPEWSCKCGETVDEGFGQCWSCMLPFEEGKSIDG